LCVVKAWYVAEPFESNFFSIFQYPLLQIIRVLRYTYSTLK
jgi:hypothetical protein